MTRCQFADFAMAIDRRFRSASESFSPDLFFSHEELMRKITKELDQAYRKTLFHVRDREFDFVIRIGEFSPDSTEAIRSMGGEGATFVTAWNPCGQELTQSENHETNDQLEADMPRLGANVSKGIGKSPENDWFEESFFAFPMSRSQTIELCRKIQAECGRLYR